MWFAFNTAKVLEIGTYCGRGPDEIVIWVAIVSQWELRLLILASCNGGTWRPSGHCGCCRTPRGYLPNCSTFQLFSSSLPKWTSDLVLKKPFWHRWKTETQGSCACAHCKKCHRFRRLALLTMASPLLWFTHVLIYRPYHEEDVDTIDTFQVLNLRRLRCGLGGKLRVVGSATLKEVHTVSRKKMLHF